MLVLLAACGTKKDPPAAKNERAPATVAPTAKVTPPSTVAPTRPSPLTTKPPGPPTPVELPKPVHGVTTLEVGDEPTDMVMVGDSLVWCDGGNELWMMPSHGGAYVALSRQQDPGHPMINRVVAFGDKLVAATDSGPGDLAMIDLVRFKKRPFGINAENESFYALATDGEALYASLFTALTVEKITIDGTRTKILTGQIDPVVRGKTLYGSDYRSGRILSVPTAGGATRVITRIAQVTGFDVDDKFIYAWSEADKHLKKIAIASGKTTDIWKTGLQTTDYLAADGEWIYCETWIDETTWKVMRIAKDGHEMQVLAEGLANAGPILITPDAVFVAAKKGDDDVILRFDKAAIEPLSVQKRQ